MGRLMVAFCFWAVPIVLRPCSTSLSSYYFPNYAIYLHKTNTPPFENAQETNSLDRYQSRGQARTGVQ